MRKQRRKKSKTKGNERLRTKSQAWIASHSRGTFDRRWYLSSFLYLSFSLFLLLYTRRQCSYIGLRERVVTLHDVTKNEIRYYRQWRWWCIVEKASSRHHFTLKTLRECRRPLMAMDSRWILNEPLELFQSMRY